MTVRVKTIADQVITGNVNSGSRKAIGKSSGLKDNTIKPLTLVKEKDIG
jgi:hypothetical protein